MKIAICDDQEIQLELMEKYIKQINLLHFKKLEKNQAFFN